MSFLGITERELFCTNIIYNRQRKEVNCMNEATRKKAVKVINRGIKFYRRELIRQLELRAEYDLHNGNLIGATLENINDCNPKKYAIIVSDLLSVKRAIQNGKNKVNLYASLESREDYYSETNSILVKTGLDFYAEGEPGILTISAEEE